MKSYWSALARAARLPPFRPAPLVRHASAEVVLEDCPLESWQILDGAPRARIGSLVASADDCMWAVVWTCTPGTIRFPYPNEEIVHMLEGEVRLIPDDGAAPFVIGPGDVVFFEKHRAVVWEITKPVRKMAYFRTDPNDPLGRLRAKLSRLA